MISISDLHFSFDRQPILNGVSFFVDKNQKVGLVGPNGAGKTTLFRLIIEELNPDTGLIEFKGKIGYLPQHPDFLGSTVEEFLLSKLERKNESYKIEFIKLLLSKNHLLILDEPTNHLEIETREDIEEALKNFQGALLIASHDRYFLEEIGITKTFLLENGKLKEV